MNERIKELANRIWAEEYWTNPNTDKLLPAQLNKFAELIVRECAEVCRNQPNHYALKADRDNCAIAIEEHFGIE